MLDRFDNVPCYYMLMIDGIMMTKDPQNRDEQ